LPPLFYDVLSVKQLVSQPAYCFGRNVESEQCQHECQDHMKAIFELIRAYEKDHGQLPRAAFYPEKTALDADSLPVLLGRKPGGLFICPTCSQELRGLGLNYVWNQKVGGKRLSEIKDPANTWLLVDFVGAHDWMTSNGYCGHRRGVNILYADGTVKWSPPFSTEVGGKSTHRWLDWAKQ
jgi:prepilin-type processing-associated H-X9-DG protein